MAQNISVLHIAETIRGGIATYLNELHPLQAGTLGGENVHYLIPESHRCDLDAISDRHITSFERPKRSIVGFVRMAWTGLRLVRKLRPTVVHLHSTFAGALLRPLLYLLPNRPAVVYCSHGWAFSRETAEISRAIARRVERALLSLCDCVVCISLDEQKAAIAAGLSDAKLKVVLNGIASERPTNSNDRRPPTLPVNRPLKLLFVGRLDRQKGFDLLAEAVTHLDRAFELRVVGSHVVEEAGASFMLARATMLGWLPREQIEAEYDWADLVVIPSRWEGFGLVALEAMRAAKPILCFRTGALPEIVADGSTGLLCDAPSAQSLADGLRNAATFDLPGMGERGAKRFQAHFTIAETHRQLLDVYAHALAERQSRGLAVANLEDDRQLKSGHSDA